MEPGATSESRSGFRPVPPRTVGARLKGELTPKRLKLAGATIALGSIAAFLLDTHFPESAEATGDFEARRAGEAVLAELARAAGAPEGLGAIGALSARIEDDWHGPFSALSVWGASAVSVDIVLRPRGARHDVRMDLGEGVRWGYDGEAWISGAESRPAERMRVERLSFALAQLLTVPFSAISAGAKAELIAPDVLSVRFRHLGTGLRTQEWRLYVDPATKRVKELVLPLTIADPSPLTRCVVVDYATVQGIVLPRELECSLANRLGVSLHRLRVQGLELLPATEGMFAAPGARP